MQTISIVDIEILLIELLIIISIVAIGVQRIKLPYMVALVLSGGVPITTLVQGTTIKWLLNRLGLASLLPERKAYEVVRARLKRDEHVAARVDGLRSQRSALRNLVRRGMLSEHSYHELATEIDQQRESLTGRHD